MPNFNIYWKGYPHRRLPRIRVVPTRGTSVRTRSTVRAAATDTIRRPLGPELEREWKKQRFAFRRRRARKSRSSSSAVRTRKLASLRARQHIQVFGWDPEVASKVDTLKISSHSSSIKPRAEFTPPADPLDTATQTTVIDSHDGAAGSICRPKPVERGNIYSLMHVAEVPVYWTNRNAANRKKSSIASSRALRRAGEYAHVGPLDPVSRRRTYRSPQRVGRSRTYDSRIDPRALLDRERPTKSAPVNPSSTTRRTASRLSPEKGAQGSPELRRVLESMVVKSKADPQSVTPSMKSIVQTLLSNSASRTPSQRKALKQFAKELELYLQAAKSLPKQTLVPSPSATTVSAHTIEELNPYRSQFHSAGLAVTSADQKGESSAMARLKKAPSPPPTPPKDDRYTTRKPLAGKSKMSSGGEKRQETTHQTHHHYKTDSIPSFDTGTTVMDFTPPHEQTGPRAARDRRRSSSDHTIMAFTPPHEIPPPQPKSAPPQPPRASMKRSLPWLRKPETVELSPLHTPEDKDIVTASTVKAKTRNPSDILLSFSVPRDSVVEKRAVRRMDREPRELVAEVKCQDMNYRNEINAKNSINKRKLYNDAAIQAIPELSNDYAITDQGVIYVDAIAQTDFADREPSNVEAGAVEENQTVERRPPLIKIKSKTFPMNPTKCSGNCNQSAPKAPSARSCTKQYKDKAMQIDFIETPQDVKQPVSREIKRPSFKSDPKAPDRNGIYPFVSPSPFRGSSAKRSPNKSVDEAEVRTSMARKDDTNRPAPTEQAPRFPTRAAPSSLRCTQCAAEMDPSTLEQQQKALPDPESDCQPEPQSELEIDSLRRARWSHTCTARSSLECQQCAPRDVSAPVPRREEPPASPTRSPRRVSRQSPKRKDSPEPAAYFTPDWAATLESDLEEIIQSYHSPEERSMRHKVVADTMAEYAKRPPLPDPVKRPPVPKVRLRPPATCPSAKQTEPKPAAPFPSALVFVDPILRQSETVTTCSSLAQGTATISDRAVFRGLHVATAAACDEDVAKWIEEITGTGIRRFLADLSAFDGLGFNTLAGVARKAAKQRREEVRAWEKIRERRLQERDGDDDWEDFVVEENHVHCEGCVGKEERRNQGGCNERKMGFEAADETIDLREKSISERSREEVLDWMIKAKGCRSREGLRERAVRMGWRDKSVSGEV